MKKLVIICKSFEKIEERNFRKILKKIFTNFGCFWLILGKCRQNSKKLLKVLNIKFSDPLEVIISSNFSRFQKILKLKKF